MAERPCAADAQEAVGAGGGEDGVHRAVDVAVGAVLEADRRGEAGGHLAVGLRLGGAGADGRPGDEVAVVLRGDGVERLGAGREPQLVHVEQELAAPLHPLVDAEGVVHPGVVDEPLPAQRGARLLEVDAHDEQQGVGELVGERAQAPRVVEPGDGIVDGAGAHHHEEAAVAAVEDGLDGAAGGDHGGGGPLGEGVATLDLVGRGHEVERATFRFSVCCMGHPWYQGIP